MFIAEVVNVRAEASLIDPATGAFRLASATLWSIPTAAITVRATI